MKLVAALPLTSARPAQSEPAQSDSGKNLCFEVIDRFTSEIDQLFMQNVPPLDLPLIHQVSIFLNFRQRKGLSIIMKRSLALVTMP